MEREHIPELLSPAGDAEGMRAAINAGADAIYLGGDRFGARAYAKNFSVQEILDGLFYAHVRGKKIYLTVNTVLKNTEIKELYTYLQPLVKGGLDGVIVQDYGVAHVIGSCFPNLPLHASTQMAITSAYGAKELLAHGFSRVVPARELSAEEIKDIAKTGIETEIFIHGAMCYCYSGQCLFSSMLGQRSGNRGRCAQPCRLPYEYEGEKEPHYLLSMKDMCTLNILPLIIQTSASSLKIEGRMKNAAYTAGVTAIYRKYIDLYQSLSNKADYQVDVADMKRLQQLYVRSQQQTGYYSKEKGRDMITLINPGYSGDDKTYIDEVHEQYVNTEAPLPVDAYADFTIGQPMKLTLRFQNDFYTVDICATGDTVLEAKNRPLLPEQVKERICKTGGSGYEIKNIELHLDEQSFVPVGSINELKRNAIQLLDHALRKSVEESAAKESEEVCEWQNRETMTASEPKGEEIIVFVNDMEQLRSVLSQGVFRRIVISDQIFMNYTYEELSKITGCHQTLMLQMPAVCRNAQFSKAFAYRILLYERAGTDRIYCNQADQVYFLEHIGYCHEIAGDINLYCCNDQVAQFWKNRVHAYTVSAELNRYEIIGLAVPKEIIVYGAMPLMHTANCVANTSKDCRKRQKRREEVCYLTDRQGIKFPVQLHCDDAHCYNTIFNSVPISLHKQWEKVVDCKASAYQIRFTTEQSDRVNEVLSLFRQLMVSGSGESSFTYTNGHFLKGIM